MALMSAVPHTASVQGESARGKLPAYHTPHFCGSTNTVPAQAKGPTWESTCHIRATVEFGWSVTIMQRINPWETRPGHMGEALKG